MSLYANENGTLQQLSDKSSGSNPYGQLEVAYSRNFADNPLKFTNSVIDIEHSVLTNKPIDEYHILLGVKGAFDSNNKYSFYTLILRIMTIPAYYKYNQLSASLDLDMYCSMTWYLPSDKTSNILKYKYTTGYPTGGYSVSGCTWDFYLI